MKSFSSKSLVLFTLFCILVIALVGYFLKIEQSINKNGLLNENSDIEIWVNTDELNFLSSTKKLNLSIREMRLRVSGFRILEAKESSYKLWLFVESFSPQNTDSNEISLKIFAETKNLWEYFAEIIRGFFGKRKY